MTRNLLYMYCGRQTHAIFMVNFILCCHTLIIIFSLWFLDVAFEVGGDSGVEYLVLQVHYGKVDNFIGELSRLACIALNKAFASSGLVTMSNIKNGYRRKWMPEYDSFCCLSTLSVS